MRYAVQQRDRVLRFVPHLLLERASPLPPSAKQLSTVTHGEDQRVLIYLFFHSITLGFGILAIGYKHARDG